MIELGNEHRSAMAEIKLQIVLELSDAGCGGARQGGQVVLDKAFRCVDCTNNAQVAWEGVIDQG